MSQDPSNLSFKQISIPPAGLRNRPLSVTILGWVFIAVGTVGSVYHLHELSDRQPGDYSGLWVLGLRVLAIAGGAFLLRGLPWARWLLVAWMVYHLVLSALHSPVELVMHLVLFSLIGYFLFYPPSSRYFRRKRGGNTRPPQEKQNEAGE